MSLLAWPITLFGLIFMWPWARRWLRNAEPLLLWTTTFALSSGTLSLLLLWLGLLGIRIDWRIAFALCTVICGIGVALGPMQRPANRERGASPRSPLWSVAAALILILAALIVFNAVYWPFAIDDAVAIYAWQGKQIAQSGMLPPLAPGALYEGYPMAVPLLYAFTHQAAGWVDEGLARLIPALMSVGVLSAAYLLGKTLYNQRTGMIAALLVAFTPMFTHWASTGYVDLPAGFFFGMAAVFAARWQQLGGAREALLAGIMGGLAAWTKNSGLLVVVSFALWLFYRWLSERADRPLIVRYGAVAAAGFAFVALPWYARNLALAGYIIPPTGWTWLAERTFAALLPYLDDPRYSYTGYVFTIGLLFTFWGALRRDRTALFLLLFYLPFFSIWWALFSYDGRFLLALTAIIAVMSARAIALVPFPAVAGQRAIPTAVLALLLVALALPAASAAVDHKAELLRAPLTILGMTLDEKHRILLGPRYDVALYLRTLPAGSEVWTSDTLLPYHADGVRVVVGGMPASPEQDHYDFWVLQPNETLPDWFAQAEPLYTVSQWRVYHTGRRIH